MTRIPSFAEMSFGQSSADDTARADVPAWQTPEGIAVKPAYAADDLKGLDFLDEWAGQ